MNRDEDPQLWDLLAKASTPVEASPFFARNVLRAVRSESRDSWLSRWLSRRSLVPTFAGALAAFVVTLAGLHFAPWHQSRPSSPSALLVADDESDDLNLLADADDDSDDDSQLL